MRRRKGIIVFILLVLIAIGVGLVIYFNRGKDNFIGNIFNDNSKDNVITDNKNGFYIYEVKLDKVIKPSYSCTITSYKYYVVVINNKWYSYKETCLGTYQLDTGNIKDLVINYDNETKRYSLEYDGNTYEKSDNVVSINPKKSFEDDGQKINLEGYKTIFEYIMFEDKDYNFVDRQIVGVNRFSMSMSLVGGVYKISILSDFSVEEDKKLAYEYSSKNIEDFPEFSIMNGNLVIIDKVETENKLNYDLKVLSYKNGFEYSLDKVFPIILNGEELSPSTHNIFVSYDYAKKKYVLLVSDNKNFCVDDSDSDEVAYYEFNIGINYLDYTFETPTFVKTWYQRDGCNHFNGLKGE